MDDKTLEQYKAFLNGHTDGQALLALEDVLKSGLSPEVLEAAKVRIFDGNTKTLKERLGQTHVEGLSLMQSCRLIEFPYFNEKGEITLYRYKLYPTIYRRKDNEPIKYLHPKDAPALPYILPTVWELQNKPHKPLWITEGEKKTLKLAQHGRHCIGLSGVWQFRAGKDSVEIESKDLWSDMKRFSWTGRRIFLGFDNDLFFNPNVRKALYVLAFRLKLLKADMRFAIWQGAKGIDDQLYVEQEPEQALVEIEKQAKSLEDFITEGHLDDIIYAVCEVVKGSNSIEAENLVSIVGRKLKLKPTAIWKEIKHRQQKAQHKTTEETESFINKELYPYHINDDGSVSMLKRDRDNDVPHKLADFTARIIEDIHEDNGLEPVRRLVIVAGTKTIEFPKVRIPAEQFEGLKWVMKHYGTDGLIEPGQNTHEQYRYFVHKYSKLSGIERRTIYTHTGFRKINGKFVYLTASGAIGDDTINVELPGTYKSMGRYCLPPVPENELEAIKTSLSFLDIGPKEITYPAYAYIFLAPLVSVFESVSHSAGSTGAPNFSAYFKGDSGTFKSTVAVLMLSHWGRFSISHLQNFDSSIGSIEKESFILGDCLMLLDDLHPSADAKEDKRKQSIAQQMIRKCSNRTSRNRLMPDTSNKPSYDPRCMLLITAEILIQNQSSLARIMLVEFNKGDIDKSKLSDLQRKKNTLPHAMTSYILWLIDNLDRIKDLFSVKQTELRDQYQNNKRHSKMADQLSYLHFTLDLVLYWATEKGAITVKEADKMRETGLAAFKKNVSNLTAKIEDEDPIKQFFEIFDACLSTNIVRLDHPKYKDGHTGDGRGLLIGRYDKDYIYVIARQIWHMITEFTGREGGRFPHPSHHGFYDSLAKRGYIESKNGEHTLSAKMGGTTERVLKFPRNKLPFDLVQSALATEEDDE